jgi:translocation and assembly module TamA
MTEFLDLTRESYEVGSVEDLAVLLIPGTTLAYASQWQAEPLELGWKADLRIRGASAPLSTVSFLQADIRAELALPLGERARVLTRTEFGTTYAGSLARLPPSIRYFAGGDRSIRGYALDELGPEDDNGEVVGGRHLAVGSIELERMIRGRWSLAVFLDAGGAFNDRSDPTYSGVGVGARWHSPFGPIRVDLAVPLDDVQHSIRIHLGIGSTFR